MANVIPSQTRAIDAFSEYNSNATNRLNRIISKGSNCLISNNDIDVILDSTSPTDHIIVTQGSCIKDDIFITILSDFRVDLSEPDFYINGPPFNEAGDYYLVLDYTYLKSKPAPQASIKILKPSQHAFLTSFYLLLKVINVSYIFPNFEIDHLSDYDLSTPSNKRIYSQTYTSLESFLPTFNSDSDIGRLVFNKLNGITYIGTEDGWKEFGTLDYECDTSLCLLHQLVYINGGNIATPAISTSVTSFATAFVLRVGVSGKVRITGIVSDGLVQSGITLVSGDTLYVSSTEAGTVTNILPVGENVQIIGTCISTTGSNYSTLLCSLAGVEGNLYHNSLLGLDGGDSTSHEFYHLTLNQFNNIGDGDHNSLASLQGGNLTERYHLTQLEHDNLGDGTHNQINGVQGGDSTDVYHLTLVQHTNLIAFNGDHNDCPSGLQGGSVSERYHLTQSQYNNLGDGTHNGLSGLQGGSVSERYHLTSLQYTNIVGFPSGTRLIFPQATAPVGWTQVTTYNDRVIRIVNGAGGGTGGSWTISGLTGASHIHTTGNHKLDITEIPYHSHPLPIGMIRSTGIPSVGGGGIGWSAVNENTSPVGGGLPHNHGVTGSPSSTVVTSSGVWRPAYLDVIIAQKN